MFPQCSHITRKRGVYFFRRRLPRPHRGEVVVSLRTKNFREAEHLASFLGPLFNRAVSTRKSMTTADLKAILRQYLSDALDADLQHHRNTKPGLSVYSGRVPFGIDPVEQDIETIDHLISECRDWLIRREVSRAEPTLSRLMTENNVPAGDRVELGLGLLQVNVQVLERARERVLGGAVDPLTAAPVSQTINHRSDSETAAPTGPLLSEVLPAILDYMVKEEGWRGQTLAQNSATYRMLQEYCGDKPIQAYTRKDMASFYDLLRALPALWSKNVRWKGLSLREIADQTKGEELPRMTMKTVKRHFSALGRVFTYLKKQGKYEGDNPAHGFEFPKKGRARDKRKMWEGEKLSRLFQSPVWAGCASEGRRAQPGSLVIKDDKYWLPLLGLYHGNRLEEFAQLRRSDIQEDSGIWYFDIHDGGDRHVKNEQSVRLLPLHPAVQALGFLKHVEDTAKGADDLVFPTLQPGGPDNKLGFYFTKWWTRYRRSLGLYERGLDYHSFRHGVTTKLVEANVHPALIDQLTGHEGVGTTSQTYTKTLRLRLLSEAISKVEWPEVDFLHKSV